MEQQGTTDIEDSVGGAWSFQVETGALEFVDTGLPLYRQTSKQDATNDMYPQAGKRLE